MRMFKCFAVLLLSATCMLSQTRTTTPPPKQATPQSKPGTDATKPTPEKSPKPAPDTGKSPAAKLPAKVGFSIDNLDRTVDPCTDFYQFACGNWMKKNPIPSDQSEWDSFSSLYVQNQGILRDILEKNKAANPQRTVVQREIGDFYYACMDQPIVDKKGVAAIKPELDRIAAIKDKGAMMEALAHVHLVGPNPIFGFGSRPDFHDANMTVAEFDQNGLTLPDRDYYLKTDEKTQSIRKAYDEYMVKVFTLAGESPDKAQADAKTVLEVETEIAKASMERVLRRDPKNRDHKMKLSEVEAMAPNFEFARYLKAVNGPSFAEVNVGNPEFFKQMNGTIEKFPLGTWKTYITWQMLNNIAPWLSDPFVQANFKFQQALTGQQELQVRWKRCVDATDASLGEALGQPYVQETFGADGKKRMLKMVDALEKSLDSDIRDLPWMTPDTKKQAKIKLDAIRNMIGYPDKWRDYSSIKIERSDLAGNVLRATEFESRRQLNKIGKPVDKTEWGMTPPTVNAYYSGSLNEIVFPAGILQPPFFDKSLDDPINFGGIGAVIGHELTHGFDDQGRKYDPQGNLRDWWTAKDGQEFEQRASCIADEYGQFSPIDDLKLNGKLTLGENTADNGGARIALMALLSTMQSGQGNSGGQVDGFSPEQRFFLGFASVWCENRTPEVSRMLVTVDPHSPGKFRTNGVVQNMPEFQKAFNCKAGQPMVRTNACRVW